MAQASDTNEKRGFFLSELFYPWLCLWTVFVGALFCYFIPICFIHFSSIIEKGSGLKDPSYFVPSLIEKSIASDQVRISLLLSVVIAIPLFVENVLDCLYPLNHADERILWYSKFLVLISLTVPNFLILIRCNGSSSGVGYILAFNYSRMAITGCTIAYASQIALKCRMEEISKFCWVLVVASITAYSMDSYSYIFDPSMRPIFQTCCVAFRLLSLILSVIGVRAWLRQAHSVGQPFTSSEVVIFVQLLAAVICSIMYGATAIYYGATNFLETPSECICGYTYIQMLYTVTIMTIPGRIARFEVSNVTQSMRERQAFIRYISHEIRTPLNAVFLGLEFITSTVKHIPILESQASMDSIVETISDVYSSCEVAISILNDLLTFDKIESGKMALEIESINCCSFFNSLVKPFNVNARNKQISFHLDFSELSPKFIQHACIKVDQGKMGQVIRNLISNALKFTPHGGSVTVAITHFSIGDKSEEKVNTGAELNVLSRFHETGGAPGSTATVMDIMRLEVRDTGAGISSANLTQLFGQYVQFNANKLQKGDGSGLGLWISKGITELHGGIIGAFSSGEGKGSVFYVELPVTILGSGSGYDNFCEDEDKDTDIDKDKNKESVLRKPLPVLNDCQQKTFSGDSNLSTNSACFGGKIVDMDIDSPMPDAEPITSFSEDIERSLISGRQLISMPPEHSLSNTPTCAPTSTLLLLPLLEGVSAEEADDDLEGTAGHAESNVFVLKDDDDGKYVDITTARSSTKVDSRRYLESSTVERKQHSGMSSVSSHSSGPHCVQPLSEKSSIFSTLADLLRETIQNSISESLLSRNDSNDFILSAQPFMVTSMPFSRSIASSRNSGSRVPTRYASLSTTPYYNISSCHTPAKIGSGRNSPNATTGHSTPLYSSPFNSPRTSGKYIRPCLANFFKCLYISCAIRSSRSNITINLI